MKKIFDSIIAGVLIVLVLPVLVFAWFGLKFEGTSPILTTGDNPGNAFLAFNCSITSFGSFLRRYSIDRLPALFDVLAGNKRLHDFVSWIFAN